MKMIATLFVVFAFASSAFGHCPFSPFIPEADIGAIAGRWYNVIEPTLGGFPQNLTNINTMNFTPREDGNFNLTISGTDPDGSNKSEHLLAERTEHPQRLNIYEFSKNTPYKVTFTVMETDDYVNYLGGYFCLITTTRSFPVSGGNFSRTDSMNAIKNVQLTDLLVDKVGVSGDRVRQIIN
uniref:Lipocalin/cytosolic fatty-acid binding domain-containing protein n=2 Tax=Tetranychus urticae TaxID=32264 RepID=T1K7A6_TETUR